MQSFPAPHASEAREHPLPEFRLKHRNSDFEVWEVPLIPRLTDVTEATQTYAWLEKSGISTFDACTEVARAFGIPPQHVRSLGLKDEEAITRQVISIEKIVGGEDMEAANRRLGARGGCSLRLTQLAGYGLAPCSERRLHGNVFRIVVRNLAREAALELREYCAANRSTVAVNYYDSQRFGLPGGPFLTHLLGRAIVERDWKEARRLFISGGNRHTHARVPDDAEEFFRTLDQRRVAFFVAAYNSALWNAEVSARLRALNRAKGWDVTFPHGPLYLLSTEDFDTQLRVSVDGYAWRSEEFACVAEPYSRSVVYHTQIFVEAVDVDDAHPGRWAVQLSFMLPSGSYATMLVAQLLARVQHASESRAPCAS
jgi:tRNA pseudouridine13 synthase